MGGVGPAQADNGPHSIPIQAAGTAIQGTYGTGIQVANIGGDQCASCHRAHTAKAEFLLKEAQPALCYTCHAAGMGASTDVRNGQDQYTKKALRGGGFNYAKIDSGNATKEMGPFNGTRIGTVNQVIPALPTTTAAVATTSRHEIDGVTGGTAWGNGAFSESGIGKSLTLECGSCHDPHGNGNYRILKPIPDDSGYAVREIRPARLAVPDDPNKAGDQSIPPVAAVISTATGIKIPDAGTKVYTTANYWLAGDTNVPPDASASYTGELTGAVNGLNGTSPDGYIANVANWCTTCHTRYLATTQSYKTPLKDAAGVTDTKFMYRHRSDANYKAGAANCITCHVSHGSNAKVEGASVGLNPGDTSVVGADSRLLRVDNRGTCVMCHNV